MNCPYCQKSNTRVIDTNHNARGGIRRRRACNNCSERFTTYERPVLSTPLLIKKDGTREEFSRDKLMEGLRLACTKRPISAETLERIAGEVESELAERAQSEIKSKVVGDLVITKLREVDDVAYLRYAIVYLQLNDLDAIKSEINRLLQA